MGVPPPVCLSQMVYKAIHGLAPYYLFDIISYCCHSLCHSHRSLRVLCFFFPLPGTLFQVPYSSFSHLLPVCSSVTFLEGPYLTTLFRITGTLYSPLLLYFSPYTMSCTYLLCLFSIILYQNRSSMKIGISICFVCYRITCM